MKIAIASGKGGTGKTFVATNLFTYIQKRGVNVVLADCDTEVPNSLIFIKAKEKEIHKVMDYRPIINPDICKFCGKCVDYCSYNAIFYVPSLKKISLIPELCHGCKACSVACEYGAIDDSELEIGVVRSYKDKEENKECNIFEGRMKPRELTGVPTIKSTIRYATIPEADYYLFDSPPGTACPFIQTVTRADFIILVTEPTPFGLSDLKQSIETLKKLNKPYGVIVNRSDLGNNDLTQYLKNDSIDLISSIPFSKKIASSYAKGNIEINENPESEKYFKEIYEYLEEKRLKIKL